MPTNLNSFFFHFFFVTLHFWYSSCIDSTLIWISIAWFIVSLLVCLVGVNLTRSIPTSIGESVLISPQPNDDVSSEEDVNTLRIIDGRMFESTTKDSKTYHSLPNPMVGKEEEKVGLEVPEERLVVRNFTEGSKAASVPAVQAVNSDEDSSDKGSNHHQIQLVTKGMTSTASAVVIGLPVLFDDAVRLGDSASPRRRFASSIEETTRLGKSSLFAVF